MILSRLMALAFLSAAIVFNCSAGETTADSTDYDDIDVGFYLGLNADFTNPERMSKGSYLGDYGVGGQLGIKLDTLNGWLGFNLFASYDDDVLKLKKGWPSARVYQTYLGFVGNIFILRVGSGCGLLKLSMPQGTFDSLGETTQTELGRENNLWQFSEYLSAGAHIPFPVKNDIMNRFSLDYDYRFISADRAMLVWHGVLSSIVLDCCIGVTDAVINNFFKENKELDEALILAATIGGEITYWYYNYSHHNWPFHDGAPFRYGINTVLLSYKFGRFK